MKVSFTPLCAVLVCLGCVHGVRSPQRPTKVSMRDFFFLTENFSSSVCRPGTEFPPSWAVSRRGGDVVIKIHDDHYVAVVSCWRHGPNIMYECVDGFDHGRQVTFHEGKPDTVRTYHRGLVVGTALSVAQSGRDEIQVFAEFSEEILKTDGYRLVKGQTQIRLVDAPDGSEPSRCPAWIQEESSRP